MKVIGIDCSQRAKSTSSVLLQEALQAVGPTTETEVIRLIDYTLELCTGCNQCVEGGTCPLTDDFDSICEKLIAADALIFASPVYWGRYPTILSCFVDRMRKFTKPPHPLFKKRVGLIVQSGITDNAATIGSFSQLFKSFGMINVISVGLGMIDYEGNPEEDDNAVSLAHLVGERVAVSLHSEKIKSVFG